MRSQRIVQWLSIIVLAGAAAGCSSVPQNMTESEREAIVQEIQQTLDNYANAVVRKDLETMESFWSDVKGFVFAGDGIILGGREKWSETMTQHARDTEKYDYFRYSNVHVEALAVDAASATVEFAVGRQMKDGKSGNLKGSWTYVFKKHGNRWRVIQTNGTHVPF